MVYNKIVLLFSLACRVSIYSDGDDDETRQAIEYIVSKIQTPRYPNFYGKPNKLYGNRNWIHVYDGIFIDDR